MKKQIICMALSASLVMAGGAASFAAEAAVGGDSSKTVAIVPDMNFTGTMIKLSLDEAIKHMQTDGLSAQTVEIQKKSDEALAKGYGEQLSSIKDQMNEGTGTANYLDRDAAKLKKEFALANTENNYKASLNKISSDTVSVYYGVLLAQDMVKAAEDNLAIAQSLLTREQQRFNLGLASKIDLTKAQNSVATAQNSLEEAKTTLTTAKMGFNISMDYPVMQSVTFTDALKELPAPTVSLEAAVKSGLENRMEIKQAVLMEQIKASGMDHLGLTMSKSSATYMQNQIEYMKLQMNTKAMPKQIEQEIRDKYMDVQSKKSALTAARNTKALADESYRLAMISYESGMNTITDVQQAQLGVFQANQGVSNAVKDYDLAVYAYEFSHGVGTAPVSLSM